MSGRLLGHRRACTSCARPAAPEPTSAMIWPVVRHPLNQQARLHARTRPLGSTAGRVVLRSWPFNGSHQSRFSTYHRTVDRRPAANGMRGAYPFAQSAESSSEYRRS